MKKAMLVVFLMSVLSYESSHGQNYFPQPSGDVGIGISPSTVLHVFKNAIPTIKLESTDGDRSFFRIGETSDFRGGFLEYDGSVNTFFIGYHNTADILTSNDVRTISIRRTNGHVGINEAVPAALFSVGAGSLFQVNSSGLMYTQPGSASYPSHGFATDHNTGMYSSGDETIDFATDGVNRLSITSTGKIGIGTTSPQSALHVNGDYFQTSPDFSGTFKIEHFENNRIVFSHSSFGSFLNAGPDNVVRFDGQQINASQRGAYLSNGLGGFSLETAAGTVALNTVSGNTLIGTNVLPTGAADAKLAVKGNIYAQKVKVTQTGWADYVFDKSYHLRPLHEVERFIQKNSHLPDVPSAAEVEKNGIDLGDSQATLLKKIEELTLYLIEQNKTLLDQHKKLELQQQQINELKQQLKTFQK